MYPKFLIWDLLETFKQLLATFTHSLGAFLFIIIYLFLVGAVAGAWCASGQTDDCVDPLMHVHILWQSRHGWKREAARAPSSPSRARKLTRRPLLRAQLPGSRTRLERCLCLRDIAWRSLLRVWWWGVRKQQVGVAAGGLSWWHQWPRLDLLFVFKHDTSDLKVWLTHTEDLHTCFYMWIKQTKLGVLSGYFSFTETEGDKTPDKSCDA